MLHVEPLSCFIICALRRFNPLPIGKLLRCTECVVGAEGGVVGTPLILLDVVFRLTTECVVVPLHFV